MLKNDKRLKCNQTWSQCYVCSKVFKSKNWLMRHLHTHIKETEKQEPSTSNSSLTQNVTSLAAKADKEQFQCGICSQMLVSRQRLSQHIKINHLKITNKQSNNDNMLKCHICSKNFIYKARHSKHVLNHMKKEKEQKISATKSVLDKAKKGKRKKIFTHKSSIKNVKEEKILTVQSELDQVKNRKRKKIFTHESVVEQVKEEKILTPKSVRDQVKKGKRKEIFTHESVVEQVKEEKIYTPDSIVDHEVKEKEQKILPAKSIRNQVKKEKRKKVVAPKSKISRNKSFRSREIQIKGKPNEQDQLKCYVCSREFKGKRQLVRHVGIHMRILLDERKQRQSTDDSVLHLMDFECKICRRIFTSKPKLYNHLTKVHLNKKMYQCKLCVECFPDLVAFRIHNKLSHKVKKKLGKTN